MQGNINIQIRAADLMRFNLMEGACTLGLYLHRDYERNTQKNRARSKIAFP